MRTGRPKSRLMLAPPDRKALERWVRRPKTAQALAQRARMVLACESYGQLLPEHPSELAPSC